MAFAWMFLPHVIRGIIGLIIVLVKGLPKSDEIIEHVKIENISTLYYNRDRRLEIVDGIGFVS